MRNRIQYLFLSATFFCTALVHVPSNAQKRGFDDELVSGTVSSYYAVRGVSVSYIKSLIKRFVAKVKKSEARKIVVLRDGRVFINSNSALLFELIAANGFLRMAPSEIRGSEIVAFDATATINAIRNNRFNFAHTNILPVIPPTIVSPERFLDHLITWLRARGIFNLENMTTKLALYDLIARNPYVRVAGVEDIELVLIGLRALGLDLDHFDEFGETMLFAAIREDNVEFVRAIVNVGVDLNLVNRDAQLPDEFALEFGNEEIMDLLDAAVPDEVEEQEHCEKKEEEKKSDSDIIVDTMVIEPQLETHTAGTLSSLLYSSF